MNNDELIEYAIRTSNAIKEEVKPKLIDYFYKQREVINRAIRTLEIQIEIIKEQPSDNDVNDNMEIRQREAVINLLKGVENE